MRNQTYPMAAPYVVRYPVWEPETGEYGDVKDALHYEVGDRAYFYFEGRSTSNVGLLILARAFAKATGVMPNFAVWLRGE